MPGTPPTLTTKELTAIEEQLGSEQEIIRKYQMCSQNATDPTLQTLCQEMASKHQRNYDTLYGHLS